MENIDVLFYALLEKESKYKNVFLPHKNYNVNNMEITVLFNQGIKIYIVLEYFNFLHYRVLVFYELCGLISKFYEVKNFSFKCYAHEYIKSLNYKFKSESLGNIFLNYLMQPNKEKK